MLGSIIEELLKNNIIAESHCFYVCNLSSKKSERIPMQVD